MSQFECYRSMNLYARSRVTEAVTGPGPWYGPTKQATTVTQLSLSVAINTQSTRQQVQQTSIIHIQLGSSWSLFSCNCPATSTAVNRWLAYAIVEESSDSYHKIDESRCKQMPFSVLKIPTMLVNALVMMSCLVFRLNTRWNHRSINSVYTGALWPLMANLRRS